ncbi:MAG: SDR family oxidoreductase [Myxococcota bacterium]|nr:short-chain dehydrogenase [Deltaproteobacteria bacterium]MCP4239976.1 SDR family oxidoreductase [bacterium]MDP6075239.1 SDR family oxidoreductase [Myxococcota bacterium]MDP6243725.1 SDR family oxidoreductase [Myxococcota bacterium]MDP7074994.1 SDR family oxidoreductase [Myxococcota bacterium]
MILEGKTILVTGVGEGLGGEVARLAHRDGANVMIAARREASLQAIAKDIDPAGARMAWNPGDITDAEQCELLAAATVERFGRIDGLVQVAALDALFGGLDDVTSEDFRRAFEVNVIGTTQIVKAAAEKMKQTGGGSVVLIGSQSSFKKIISQIAYASSKGALHTAMYFMASELGQHRIRVNHVVPTWMWGPPVERYVGGVAKQRGVSTDEVISEIVSDMAIPEIPADEDVAESAIFLCSDRAKFVTGQTLFVNSGQLMP